MMYPSTGCFSPRTRSWARPRTALLPAACAPLVIALLLPLLLPLAACDKTKETECRKAITNIRKIYGTEDNSFGVSPDAMVRACQGSASPESVRCFIQASSVEDLRNCEGDAFKEMFEGEAAKGEEAKGEEAKGEAAKGEEASGEAARPEASGEQGQKDMPGAAPEGEQQGGDQGAPAQPDPGSGP
jgi:hypothetical protein